MRKMNLNKYFAPYMKINARWTRDLFEKAKTLKLLNKRISCDFKAGKVPYRRYKKK